MHDYEGGLLERRFANIAFSGLIKIIDYLPERDQGPNGLARWLSIYHFVSGSLAVLSQNCVVRAAQAVDDHLTIMTVGALGCFWSI